MGRRSKGVGSCRREGRQPAGPANGEGGVPGRLRERRRAARCRQVFVRHFLDVVAVVVDDEGDAAVVVVADHDDVVPAHLQSHAQVGQLGDVAPTP